MKIELVRDLELPRGRLFPSRLDRQAVYRLETPLTTDRGWLFEYVLISSATVVYSGPETYIFPANENGEVLDYAELPGSLRNTLTHDDAIAEAGWELVDKIKRSRLRFLTAPSVQAKLVIVLAFVLVLSIPFSEILISADFGVRLALLAGWAIYWWIIGGLIAKSD